MRIVSISVTEASRNFADCVNRARYQGTTFVLHKSGVAVARIVPEPTSQAEENRESQPAERPADPTPSDQAAALDPTQSSRQIW
jgi:antitoxin (DNA-binding transcriptional repressor) of toxin-antitoxin stability system